MAYKTCNLVSVQYRWFRHDPSKANNNKNSKKRNSKSKEPSSAVKKRRIETPADDSSEDQEDELKDEDDDEAAECEISAYIYVAAPPPLVTRAVRGTKPLAPKVTACGPILLPASITYDDFLSTVAKELKCKSPASLDPSAMEWKFDRPANSKYKHIMNKTGFGVMIKTILGRKKDFVISLQMPPPARIVSQTVSSPIIDLPSNEL